MTQDETRDHLLLEHVVQAIESIQRTVAGDRTRFLEDEDVRDACLRRLQTMAESAQRLSRGLRDRHQDVPWGQIAGFRNRIVHAYLDVDLQLVWTVIEDDLPPLLRAARSELSGGG